MSQFRNSVVMGAGWEGISQAIRFAIGIILARCLTPDDFGFMAMILGVTGVAVLVSDLGLGSALVQRKAVTDQQVLAVLRIGMLVGALLFALFAAASPLVAHFYREPKLQPLMVAMAATFFISGFTVAPQALLQRAMRFSTLARVDIIAHLAAAAVAICLALRGAGAWSLVTFELLSSAIRAAALGKLSGLSWRGAAPLREVRELFGFGGPLLAANLLGYTSRNMDNILIGRYIGSGALGLYTRAYQLMMMPVSRLTHVLARIMFPALSRIQHDHAQVRTIFTQLAGIIALVSVPFTVSLGLHARPLILTLYGEAWSDAIVPLQWLALAGILQPVSSACGWLLTSQGRPDILLRLGLISTLAAVLSFVIGLPYGIVGVSAAYAGACTLLLPLNWWLPTRLVGLPISQLVKSLFPSLVAGASMWPMQLLTRVWTVDLPVPAQLLVDAGAGLSMYAVVIMIWRPSAFRNLMALRHELSPNRKPA